MDDMGPYKDLPDNAFWRLAVTERDLFEINNLWTPRIQILPQTPVATYGSCFAQNIGQNLAEHGFNWLKTEHPPIGLSKNNARDFYYDLFSARTGNIYTASLLNQWVSWATNSSKIPEEVWKKNGRYYDPFRPTVEPNGFINQQEVIKSRDFTIRAFLQSIEKAEVLVFTLGLTEKWCNRLQGFEYPLCPGVAAGDFDPKLHVFQNDRYDEVKRHLKAAVELMRTVNSALRIVLTVSPVPITATKSGAHVVVATMQSKSILRAVAADLTCEYDFIDYFPSYEIINSPAFRSVFFSPNQRSVSRQGVSFVMEQFFAGLGLQDDSAPTHAVSSIANRGEEQYPTRDQCEEALLNAFRPHR